MKLLSALLSVLAWVCTTASAAGLLGTYSNGADGFDLKTFYVLADGRAFLGVPVRWRYEAGGKAVIIKGNLGANLAVEERTLAYDPEKNHVILPRSLAKSAPDLGFVSAEVHPNIRKYLDSFDWDFEKHVIEKK